MAMPEVHEAHPLAGIATAVWRRHSYRRASNRCRCCNSEVDYLDRRVLEREGIPALVALVERCSQSCSFEDGVRFDCDFDRVLLTAIPHIETSAGSRDRFRGDPLSSQRGDSLHFRHGKEALQLREIHRVQRKDASLHAVDTWFVHQHAPSAEGAGERWDNDAAHAELIEQGSGMCRSSTTESDQGEVPRVVAATDGDELEGVDRLLVCYPDHARCSLDDSHPEPPRDRFVSRAGEIDVDLEVATEEVVRIENADNQQSVGDGRFDPAASVTSRSRIGSGREGADAQGAALIEPGDTAAAGSNLNDVDDWHFHRVTGRAWSCLQPVVGRDLHFAVFDQRA